MLNKQRGYAETLELVRRWQDPGLWSVLSQLAEQAESYQRNAERCGSDTRMLLDRGDISAAVELKSESECYRNAASGVRQQRSGLISEFLQIESWVRENAPALIECVPVADFSNADVPGIVAGLRKLESRLAAAGRAATTDDGDWPTVSEASCGFGVNKGTIAKWLRAGELRDNGKSGRARRIDPASILTLSKAKGVAYNDR
jgi:hypothetical protein